MSSIYNITNELKKIYDKLESGDGINPETGEIDEEITNALALTNENLQVKALDYAYVIKSFDDDIDIYDKEIARLTERKRQLQATKERLKETVSQAMQDFGIVEIKGKTVKLCFRESESVEITDETLISQEFFRVKVEPDKVAIKKALKNGENVQGVKLIQKRNLQIK